MGRIARGKRRIPGYSWQGPGGFKWMWPRRFRPDDDSEEMEYPMMSPLKKLWHWPDRFHWMGPLPYFHRRGILISALIIAMALLWPYSPPDDTPAPKVNAPAGTVMQADLVGSGSDGQPGGAADVPTAGGQQSHYRIVDGQTLAQLFRQHNLPVADVFAMAQAEGEDKPLSSLQAGQQVTITQNAQGVVTALEIETGSAGPVRFIRRTDGSYERR